MDVPQEERADSGAPVAPLPAALIELLVHYGLQTEPGRAAVAAVMAYYPALKSACESTGGQLRITVQGEGTLAAGGQGGAQAVG